MSIADEQDWHEGGRRAYRRSCFVPVQRNNGQLVLYGGIEFAVRSTGHTGCVDRSSTTRLCFVFAFHPSAIP